MIFGARLNSGFPSLLLFFFQSLYFAIEDFIALAGPGLDHQLRDLHVGYATVAIACGGIYFF